jgi:hypothetical protein
MDLDQIYYAISFYALLRKVKNLCHIRAVRTIVLLLHSTILFTITVRLIYRTTMQYFIHRYRTQAPQLCLTCCEYIIIKYCIVVLYINLTVIVNNMVECSSSTIVRTALIWQRFYIIRVCAGR